MKDTSETSPVGKSPKDERPQGKRRLSIFWRCTITNTLIYSLVFLLAVSLFMLFIGLRTWKNCEKTIRALRAELVVELRGARRYDTLWITLAHLKLPQGAAYRVMDKEGMILAETTTYLPFPLEGEETEILVNQSEEGEGQRYTTLESADWTATADGEVLLQVSYDITWFREIVEAVLFWMLIFFPFILLISLLVSYITTRISFAPVRELSQKIRKITPASLGQTVQLDIKNQQMEELLENYNAMSQRLRLSFEDQRLFVSNASHELRSPIVTIKGYSSMLLRWGKEDNALLEESLQVIDAEAQRMTDIIQTLLTMTRYESEEERAGLSFNWINLKEMLCEVKDEASRNHEGAEIGLEIKTDVMWGHGKSVAQSVRILLENALRYGKGKAVMISVYPRSSKKEVVIQVKDQGIGMNEEEKGKIGQQFYRAEAARAIHSEGLGLGIPMLVRILQSHRGYLEVESEKGVGTTMRAVWPEGPADTDACKG